MDRFVDAYEHGATPNPCIDCNRYLKFDKMFQRMRELEYDYIVTGHYARVEYDEEKNRYLLKKAVDDTKDQSYVLYMLTQEQLAHISLWRNITHTVIMQSLLNSTQDVNQSQAIL